MRVTRLQAFCPWSASQRNCDWKERKQPQLSSGGLGKRQVGKIFPSHLQVLTKASCCTPSPSSACSQSQIQIIYGVSAAALLICLQQCSDSQTLPITLL